MTLVTNSLIDGTCVFYMKEISHHIGSFSLKTKGEKGKKPALYSCVIFLTAFNYKLAK